MDTTESLLMGGTAIIVPGQMAYMKLPADFIRNYVDSKFPMLAHCPDADFIKGYGHRWMGGHDLLIDVPRTLMNGGPLDAIKHAGHIILTDFPTKAGIPIPGLSGNGLGRWLVEAGIPKGWLNIHWADGCFGLLAIPEGSLDLIQAFQGSLIMNAETFFDTFVEGGVELAVALNTASLPIAFSAIENILAGVFSVYHTVSVYVDPLDFFGSAGTSALIGFGLAYGLADGSLSEASINGLRGGAVGSFLTLSPAFGYGVLAGFVSFKLGRSLAKKHNLSMRGLLNVDANAFNQLINEMCLGNIHLAEFIDRAETRIILVDNASTLSTQPFVFEDISQILPDSEHSLDSNESTLPEKIDQLMTNMNTISDDNQILTDWYSKVLS